MRFVLKPKGYVDLDSAMEELYKRIPVPEANIRVKGDRVEVILRGVPRSSGDVRAAVMQAFTGPEGAGGGRSYTYDVGSGLRSEVLADALRAMTYDSRSDGSSLITSAPPDLVNELLRRVNALEKEMAGEVDGLSLSASARKALMAVSASTGSDVRSLLRIGLDLGLLTTNGKKVISLGPWREVAASLRRQVRLERGGAEDKEGRAK